MKRYLYKDINALALSRYKMAFISGPRQVGKTTLAKSYEKDYDKAVYKNWDESHFRRQWTKSPNDLKDEFDLTKVNKKKTCSFLTRSTKQRDGSKNLKAFLMNSATN